MASQQPSQNRVRLFGAIVLLAWVDVLGIVGFSLVDEVFGAAFMPTTMGWVWIGVDAFLITGLVLKVNWAVELIRLRCFLHFGTLVYMWMSYFLLLRPVGAPLLDALATAGLVRDGITGLSLLAVFLLLKGFGEQPPSPATPVTNKS
ncbi:MAG: hypothetical protein JRF33_04180 [Deltaproteobacteria bacterium]|nr:hypothetical protein [Deltaproteobacteria bacterium]